MSKHTNFVGMKLNLNSGTGIPEVDNGPALLAEVQRIQFPEGEEWGCDMCDGPSVAVYEINAIEALGEQGWNQSYCEEHMGGAIVYGLDNDQDWYNADGSKSRMNLV